MDILSHVLVGGVFNETSPVTRLQDRCAIVLAAFAADLPELPLYLLVGREHGRPFWIPRNVD